MFEATQLWKTHATVMGGARFGAVAICTLVLGCGSESQLTVGDGSEPATEAPSTGGAPGEAETPSGGGSQNTPPDTETVRPSRLSEHTATYLEAADAMLIFGGTDGVPSNCGLSTTTLKDEAWLFHEDDSESGGTWELQGGATPGPRLRHMAAASVDTAWIFGGRFRPNPTAGAFTLYNDLWQFDAASLQFSEVDVVGPSPPVRVNGSLCFDEERQQLWLFGGNASTDALTYIALDDLWRFDLATRSWETVEVQSDAQPSARLFHSGICDSERDQLVVFAGGDAGVFSGMSFGDLWALDLASLEWRPLDASSAEKPLPRFWQSLEWDRVRDTYVLFGGHDDTSLGNRNDLWEFDPSTEQWTQRFGGDVLQGMANGICDFPADFVDPDLNLPERRDAHTTVWSPLSESLLVFAGKTDCGSVDDLWRFTSEGDWQRLYGASQGESCVRTENGDISECAGMCSK